VNQDFLDFPVEIEAVEKRILEAADSSCGLLREVAAYVNLVGGKMLRPRLLILVAHSMGSVDERVLRVAAAVELVHMATLLHDDVIDRSTLRRGRPSVNAKYGDDVAILMADLLFSKAFDLALDGMEPEVMRLLCKVTRIMCEGEMFQIERRDTIFTEADYFRVIKAKTASLFSAAAALGGILSKLPASRQAALEQFGLNVGMAFQIVDDVFDYTGDADQLGKSVGNDLERGKQTLPLVRTFELASEADRRALLHQLRNGRQMSVVLPVIRKYGGLEYAAERARDFVEEADRLIPSLNLNSYSEVFHHLCRFVVERTR